ncbi:hypothetical protein CWI26_01025 [Streptococcus suis]|uniref:Uncharacterized protein n=1 Tax=Streptococcus suis TaxID=1307 RepID=A0A2I5KLG5_STRSU|nr:hypothetical protein CWI26_01025 [Streptococcus suis]
MCKLGYGTDIKPALTSSLYINIQVLSSAFVEKYTKETGKHSENAINYPRKQTSFSANTMKTHPENLAESRRGWAESPAPLLRVRVNISAQWLIGFNSLGDC